MKREEVGRVVLKESPPEATGLQADAGFWQLSCRGGRFRVGAPSFPAGPVTHDASRDGHGGVGAPFQPPLLAP